MAKTVVDLDELNERLEQAVIALGDLEKAFLRIVSAIDGYENDEDPQSLFVRLQKIDQTLRGLDA